MGAIDRLKTAFRSDWFWPWRAKRTIAVLRYTINVIEVEHKELKKETEALKVKLREKQRGIGVMAMWIKKAHRLDEPMTSGSIRKALNEAQSR